MIDYYGEDADYIHLKFGDMRKMYFFTDDFVEKHPNFAKEYKKYWMHDESCRFNSPFEIARYVDLFSIPVNFYFNFTDTPVKSMEEMYEYFMDEYTGIAYDENGNFREDYNLGLDGEKQNYKKYIIKKEE